MSKSPTTDATALPVYEVLAFRYDIFGDMSITHLELVYSSWCANNCERVVENYEFLPYHRGNCWSLKEVYHNADIDIVYCFLDPHIAMLFKLSLT